MHITHLSLPFRYKADLKIVLIKKPLGGELKIKRVGFENNRWERFLKIILFSSLTLCEWQPFHGRFQSQINEKSSYWYYLLAFKYIFYNCFYLFAAWRKWNYFFIGGIPPNTCAKALANWKVKGLFDSVLKKISVVFEKAPRLYSQNTKSLVQKLCGILKVYWQQ